MSFDDPIKRQFYDSLVAAVPSPMNVAVLHVGGRIVAEHCGFVWRGELAMGIPGFDVLEHRRSPGLVLLSLLFPALAAEGVRGVDFTPGLDPYKERLSNASVDLPVVDMYLSKLSFLGRRLKDSARPTIHAVKRRLPESHVLQRFVKRGAAKPSSQAADSAISVSAAPQRMVRDCSVLAFESVDALGPELPGVEIHTNELRPLLRANVPERELREVVRQLSQAASRGDRVHVLTRGREVMGWARSRVVRETPMIREIGRPIDLETPSVAVFGLRLVSEPPDGMLSHLLRIVADASGVSRIAFLALETDSTDYRRLGLRPSGQFAKSS
jgi:hypothetical protein